MRLEASGEDGERTQTSVAHGHAGRESTSEAIRSHVRAGCRTDSCLEVGERGRRSALREGTQQVVQAAHLRDACGIHGQCLSRLPGFGQRTSRGAATGGRMLAAGSEELVQRVEEMVLQLVGQFDCSV